MGTTIAKRLKNWWWAQTTLFHIEAGIGIPYIDFRIEILSCSLHVGLNFIRALRWLRVFYFFRQHYTACAKVGKNKTIDMEMYCDGWLSTGFTFYKHIHTDHTPCRLELQLLGITVGAQHYDHRHWDDKNNTYEGPKDE